MSRQWTRLSTRCRSWAGGSDPANFVESVQAAAARYGSGVLIARPSGQRGPSYFQTGCLRLFEAITAPSMISNDVFQASLVGMRQWRSSPSTDPACIGATQAPQAPSPTMTQWGRRPMPNVEFISDSPTPSMLTSRNRCDLRLHCSSRLPARRSGRPWPAAPRRADDDPPALRRTYSLGGWRPRPGSFLRRWRNPAVRIADRRATAPSQRAPGPSAVRRWEGPPWLVQSTPSSPPAGRAAPCWPAPWAASVPRGQRRRR